MVTSGAGWSSRKNVTSRDGAGGRVTGDHPGEDVRRRAAKIYGNDDAVVTGIEAEQGRGRVAMYAALRVESIGSIGNWFVL